MEIECEVCEEVSEIEGQDLPPTASDEDEWECPHCESTMMIGWYATVEVRSVVKINEKQSGEGCVGCGDPDCGGTCKISDMDFNN